jgi:hypothetical protein
MQEKLPKWERFSLQKLLVAAEKLSVKLKLIQHTNE